MATATEDVRQPKEQPALVYNRAGEPFEPNGCRWCGTPRRGHFGLYTEMAGWHRFIEPTDNQRLARMRARRDHRRPRPHLGEMKGTP